MALSAPDPEAATAAPRRVGLLGVGLMGLPIAVNLMERGFAVTGYRRGSMPDLEAAGGIAAASPAELAASSDVLVSILPGAAELTEVVLGEQGTVRALRPGTVHIEMSTIEEQAKRRVRDAVVEAGGDLLDCPISGTPPMVGPRRATTFVSGADASIEAVRAVLDAISGPWVHTGAFGTATKLKYIANLLLATHTAAAAEAMALARHSGLDLELVQRTLDDGIGSSAIWRMRGPLMQRRAWQPAPGPIATLHPIFQQIASAAAENGTTTPVFNAAKTLFDNAYEQGQGPLDIAAVLDQVDPPDNAEETA